MCLLKSLLDRRQVALDTHDLRPAQNAAPLRALKIWMYIYMYIYICIGRESGVLGLELYIEREREGFRVL